MRKLKTSAEGGPAYGWQSSKLKIVTQSAKFLVLSLIFVLGTGYWALGTVSAQPISSSDLINNAKFYDGKAVAYEGEVIGDVMLRGDYAWVNLNDAKNAIGIWVEGSLVKEIAYKGSYKAKGDWLEITGIFHRACPQHGGDLDIHALAIRKISPGRAMSERVVPDKKNFAIILFAVLCLIWILRLLRRK